MLGDLIDENDGHAHRDGCCSSHAVSVCRSAHRNSPDASRGASGAFADRTNGQRMESCELANARMEDAQFSKSCCRKRKKKLELSRKKDGLLEEVTKTTSNSWRKTKEASKKLNPIRFFPASARTPVPSRQEASQPKPGFFRSLFSPAPVAKNDDSTVTDFLSNPRPSP